MTEPIKINLPKLGESIISATVVQWFKNVGDRVELDEPLLEVSTDKINSEIPAPAAGILQEILAHPNQELQVGEALALLATQGSVQPQPAAAVAPVAAPRCAGSGMEDFLSPSVMRLLREKGIQLEEIDRIPRTGQGGRLTKKDVEEYVPAPAPAPVQAPSREDTERVKMTRCAKQSPTTWCAPFTKRLMHRL